MASLDIRRFLKRKAPEKDDVVIDNQSASTEQWPTLEDEPSTSNQEDATNEATSFQPLVFDIGKILVDGHVSKEGIVERCCKKAQSLSDDEKYKILVDHFKPDRNFTFPATKQHGCNRRCKFDNLSNCFHYSQFADAVFCLPCALLISGDKRKTLQLFVNKGCNSWHNIKEKQKLHCETRYHQQAVVDAEHFKARFEKPSGTMPHIVDKELQDRAKKYHSILLKIAEAVHFCGRQGIPYRGHREDIVELDPCQNPGNFIALLRQFAKHDDALAAHMDHPVARNATYMRPKSQNEMIHVIGHCIIQADLISEIKEAGFHSVMVDEVTASNDELMSICIRFVDDDKNIREEFLEFIDLHRITGEAITKAILEFYEKLGLDIRKLRGQCYDGCSSMSSLKKGVAGLILQHAPKATYTHCNSHVLNLSISSSCSETNIQHAIATMKDIAIFINYSPKRESLLQMVAEKRVENQGTRKVIVGLCKTRWSERDTAYEHFYLALPFLVECFEIINGTHPTLQEFSRDFVDGWDSESKREATARLKAVTDFGFIVTLLSLYHLLHPLHGLTQNLQGRTIDVVKAYSHVKSTSDNLKAVRADIENQFKVIYSQAMRIAEKLSVTPAMPRVVQRQSNRQNTPADNPEEYFRRTVAVPFLDSLISEIQTRFGPMAHTSSKLLFLVPSILCNNNIDTSSITDVMSMYSDDLPSPNLVNIELLCWKTKWEKMPESDRPDSLAKAYQHCDENFPNLSALLKIGCTLGITSAECERSFSTMRRLRNFLRSSMGCPRLSSLALMNIHYGHKIDYEKAVDIFMRLHPRRISQANLIFE